MGYKMGMLVEPTKKAIFERKLHEWQNIRLSFLTHRKMQSNDHKGTWINKCWTLFLSFCCCSLDACIHPWKLPGDEKRERKVRGCITAPAAADGLHASADVGASPGAWYLRPAGTMH
jgi:hypothetical protein